MHDRKPRDAEQADRERLVRRLSEHIAELESRLADDGGYHSSKDRRIATLEREIEHLALRARLSAEEVRALKASRSYRLGRVLLAPAVWLRRGLRRPGRAVDGGAPSRARLAPPDAATVARWRTRLEALRRRPRVSILTPVHRPQPAHLADALRSVAEQAYPEWELCLVDDGSRSREITRLLDAFAREHPGKVHLARHASRRGIAAASNRAAGLASGEWYALFDHDDLLAPSALLEIVAAAQRQPLADVIYSDEDKLDPEGFLVDPFLKPDFSPETLLASNYVCHLTAFRSDLFRRVGGFREGFEGSQDYDLVLRLTEAARHVVHVPRVLYHWRQAPGSAAGNPAAKGGPWRESSRRALRSAVDRRGWRATVEDGLAPGSYRVRFAVDPAEAVTVIIPTRDRVDLLRPCVESILAHTEHPAVSILVASNGSRRRETFEYLRDAERRDVLRYFTHDRPFNFAEINNTAAARCTSPFLLFLNNDVRVRSAGWIRSLLEHARREEIGAVGARLHFPDGRLQHAGIVLGMMGVAGHPHRGIPPGDAGHLGQVLQLRNCSAVTGACLMTRRDVFERVSGFGAEYAVAFNDVDYCLKVGAAGYRTVYTPHAVLEHAESSSRGIDRLDAGDFRFEAEVAQFLARWGEQVANDPFHNPGLALWSSRPAPRTPEDRRRTREFLARYRSVPKSRTADAPSRRSDYKPVWDALADTESLARMHVIGSLDDAAFDREALRSVEVIDRAVGIGSNDVVLEIGCGIGRVGARIAPRCRKWIGCDVSPNMLALAGERLARHDNVELLEVSGFDLEPVDTAAVDVVYCTVVFMHLDEWERYGYIAEARRVLRPGGRLFVDNLNLRSAEGWRVFEQHRALPADRRPAHISKASTPQELESYMTRASFSSVQVRERGPWVEAWAVR